MKTRLAPIISSGLAASIICRKWRLNCDSLPDAFFAEGPEICGHLGFKEIDLDKKNHSLENLVREVRQVVLSMKKQFSKTDL